MGNSYDLETGRIIQEIKKLNAKNVLLQFPDGLKKYSKEIVDEIGEKTNAKCFIFLGTCYGACDIPQNLKGKIGLLVQFGHNQFVKEFNGWK